MACCSGLCVPKMTMTKAKAKENLGEFICLSISKAITNENLQIFICNHFRADGYFFPNFFSDFCAGPVSHSVDGHRARKAGVYSEKTPEQKKSAAVIPAFTIIPLPFYLIAAIALFEELQVRYFRKPLRGPPTPRSPKTPQQQKKKFQKPRKPRLSPKVDARSPKVDARSPKVDAKYFKSRR